MRFTNPIKLANFIDVARAALADAGIVELSPRTDFDAFLELARDKCVTYKQFDPSLFCVLSRRAYWLHGLDKDGNTASIVALRFDDLMGANLTEHHMEMLPRVGGGRPKEVCALSDEITGRVVYYGAGWIAPAFRNKQCGPWLFRLGQAFALSEWEPDWMYAFIAKEAAERGHVYRDGFTQQQPHVRAWIEQPEYSTHYALAANDLKQMSQMCEIGHEEFVRDEGKPRKSPLRAVG